MMTRDLCVELVNVGQGLERTVTVDIQLFDFQYIMQSKITTEAVLESYQTAHTSFR